MTLEARSRTGLDIDGRRKLAAELRGGDRA